MENENTLQLHEPVTVDGKTYEALSFRKMKARDLLASDAVSGQLRKSMAIFASITDVPLAVIEELNSEDFEAVAMKAANYMGKRGREAAAKAALATAGEPDETMQ